MALMIIGLFSSGLYMVELSYYDEGYQFVPALHKSVGITLALLLLFRILWNTFQIKPQPLTDNPFKQRLITATHNGLYLLLTVIALSGYLISTADGRSIDIFSFFSLPATISHLKNQEDVSGIIHLYTASTLIFITSLHALMALKHHFIDKDNTLRRMTIN
ncbi:Cytochrome b561 homolog 2 [hydrothermal vent metagenome]|uniref:Cytochrome b561 homolog 2 n=1 Tax=hydrothermal vent metagenome TaxID=652676 RepID=A0A3B0YVK1_9ZZZZ